MRLHHFDHLATYLLRPSFSLSFPTVAGQSISVFCRPWDDVLSLKERVRDAQRFPPDQQRLIFADRQMDEKQWLLDFPGLCDGATVHMVLRLRAGRRGPASITATTCVAAAEADQR